MAPLATCLDCALLVEGSSVLIDKSCSQPAVVLMQPVCLDDCSLWVTSLSAAAQSGWVLQAGSHSGLVFLSCMNCGLSCQRRAAHP